MHKITERKITDLQKLFVLNRIKILEILYQNDTCVCEMIKELNIKNNLISHHLKVLQDMGYIHSKKNGQHIVYGVEKEKRDDIYRVLTLLKK